MYEAAGQNKKAIGEMMLRQHYVWVCQQHVREPEAVLCAV